MRNPVKAGLDGADVDGGTAGVPGAGKGPMQISSDDMQCQGGRQAGRPVIDTDAFEALPDPVVIIDAGFRIVGVNARSEQFLGLVREEWIGEVPLSLVHPDDLANALTSFQEVENRKDGTPIELRLRHADGEYRLTELVGAKHGEGADQLLVLTLRDLTQRRRWEVAAGSVERFRSLVEHAAAIVMLVDTDGNIDSASGAFLRQLGHDPSRVWGSELARWATNESRARLRADLITAARTPGTTVIETVLLHADGRPIPFQLSIVNLLDDPVMKGLVVSAIDITARRALEQRLTEMASRDPLTGLWSHATIVERLDVALARHRNDPARVSLFFVDLDRFKPINDLHGHEAGDVVLVTLGRRLAELARPEDLVGRLGSDEFVVLAEGLEAAEVRAFADRIEQELSAPVPLANATVQVFASVGMVDGNAATNAESLLAEADGAMWRVKERRRGRSLRSSLSVAHRREVVEDLVAALADDPYAAGLRLYYQPVVQLSSLRVVGAEALLRWQHPRLGLLSPDQFLPVAEDADLEAPLGAWVIDEALAQARQWDEFLHDGMAVNVSAAQLAEPDFVDQLHRALVRHGVRPERLTIEVTETSMLERQARGARTTTPIAVQRVKELGVRVAIDDFGTGYSSLVHVRDLPADILKVDRSFVSGMIDDVASRGVVAAVVTLAHAMEMQVVAEGIETREQEQALSQLGCSRAQGYSFGRPVPAADFPVPQVRRGHVA